MIGGQPRRRAVAGHSTLATILPKGAVGVERGAIDDDGASGPLPDLHPVEEALIAGAGDRRWREFAEARACAKEALATLGVPTVAVPATADGAPVWPDGVVGSITHKGGYRAAVVALRSDIAGIGIDAELDERLPDGVLEMIASPQELDQVEALLAHRPGPAWDRLLFCAKEAAVKAVHPLGLRAVGVRGVEVSMDAERGLLRATIMDGGKFRVDGAWASGSRLLLATAGARQPKSSLF